MKSHGQLVGWLAVHDGQRARGCSCRHLFILFYSRSFSFSHSLIVRNFSKVFVEQFGVVVTVGWWFKQQQEQQQEQEKQHFSWPVECRWRQD